MVTMSNSFKRLLSGNSSLSEISRDWYHSSEDDLRQAVERQTSGLRIILQALTYATYSEHNINNLMKIFLHLGMGHGALNRFCNVTINLRRQFPHTSLESVLLFQRINLYAIEILDLMEQFLIVSHYFLHKKREIVIFLRILLKIRMKIEKYLVHVDFWNLGTENVDM